LPTLVRTRPGVASFDALKLYKESVLGLVGLVLLRHMCLGNRGWEGGAEHSISFHGVGSLHGEQRDVFFIATMRDRFLSPEVQFEQSRSGS